VALAALTVPALADGLGGSNQQTTTTTQTTTSKTQDGDTTTTTTTTKRAAGTSTTLPGVQVAGVESTRLDGLHGRTVCELDVVHRVDGAVVADIYTTATVADCDQAAFAAVDTKAVEQQLGASLVLRNGPRVWVLDELTTSVASDGASIQPGGVTLEKSATVEFGAVDAPKPYRGSTLRREAVVVFDAGRRVYDLHDPDGNTWVMQNFSTRIDPSLRIENLDKLGSRLNLPKGWTFSSRVLDEQLRIEAPTRRMHVLQDDFSNSYVRADS
jgi:hypothetical protein